MTSKVIFLHIPKTGGQSIHAALSQAFDSEEICPARINQQLTLMSIDKINSYKVFSGHLDWSMLDCLKGNKFTFTILREPFERILSFYFFTRNEAMQLSNKELNLPKNKGKHAALNLSAHEYFMSPTIPTRGLIDGLYDNFYTYYFAGRAYGSRHKFLSHLNDGAISRENLIEIALQNLRTLQGVFTTNNISFAFNAIRRVAKKPILSDENYFTNFNNIVPLHKRKTELIKLGAIPETFLKLEAMCEMDQIIWKCFSPKINL